MTRPDIDSIPALKSPRSTKLKAVVITCNYPDGSAEAAIPEKITVGELQGFLMKLVEAEPDLTSFMVLATLDK